MKQNLEEIYRYLRATYRYRYMFTCVSILVMTLVTGYSFFAPKKYQVDSTVFIEKNVIDNLVKGIAITPDLDGRIKVLKYALLSRDLLTKTLEEIDSSIFTKSVQEQQSYLSKLKERIDLRVKGNDLFIISLVDSDPVFAQKFINTLVSKYVEENISSKRDETYGANRFLQEQIEVFKQKLEKAEDAIIAFRQKQGIYFSVDEQATLSTIKDYMLQLENLDLEIGTLNAKKARLQQQLNSLTPTVDSVLSGSAAGSKLAALQMRLENLRLRYTDNYPEIVRLKSEIASFHEQLSQTDGKEKTPETSKMTSLNPLHQDIQEKLFEVEAEVSSLLAKKHSLESLVAKRQQDLASVPTNKKELGLLIQQRDSHRKIYEELLARMGRSEVSKQMEISNKAATFRIVDPAILPKVPVSPNMLKMLFLAIIGGLGCGFGAVFLRENFDTRVRDISFLDDLGIEILAVVPNITNAQEMARNGRKDLLLASFFGLYMSGVIGVFAYTILLLR
ncbi:XrtA system polysaccharide chain length determinant [Geopsychrobacter electrodiphilus]|uniref:XrtA system polysaccharide chain length determinant n=1 Tax=Geopsychrobacter electrodiphilus TaxID=225196 RepID=UPI0003811F92|nr:XrtA system polysaccharide chain length determinant [Geopsychrobacter electrodiphilus]